MECFRQEGTCDSLSDKLTIKCKIGVRLFTTFFNNHVGITSKEILLCIFKIMALTDSSETGTKSVISIVGETLRINALLVFSKSC